MFVWERMTRNPVTIGPDDRLSVAAEKMLSGRFRRLPVIEQGNLIGILSEYDLQAHLASLDTVSVRAVMTANPIVVEPSTTLERAAGLISTHRIGALPVMDRGELVGIVAAHDMLLPEPRPLPKWVPL